MGSTDSLLKITLLIGIFLAVKVECCRNARVLTKRNSEKCFYVRLKLRKIYFLCVAGAGCSDTQWLVSFKCSYAHKASSLSVTF